jgi:Flp pilus assembly protein TadG
MVEAAVTFPLVALLLLLIVQASLYVHARHVALAAAREAAHASAVEVASDDDAVEIGTARARDLLTAGLGEHAAAVQVVTVSVDEGSVVVEIQGSMPVILAGPVETGAAHLPFGATARASREFFRPQGAGGF